MNSGVRRRPRLESVTSAQRACTWLLWAGGVLPELVGSAVLALMVLTLLPGLVVWLLLGVWVAISVLLAIGRLKWPAVQVLMGGQRLSPPQADRLILPLAIAATIAAVSGLEIGIASPRTTGRSIGPNVVLIEHDLINRYFAGRASDSEVAWRIARGVSRLRVDGSRFDLLVTFWCLPAILLRRVARAVLAGVFRLPLVGLMWQGRFLLGIAVLINSHLTATLPIGLAGAAIIALSYLLPWVRRVRERHLDQLAHAVLQNGVIRAAAGLDTVLDSSAEASGSE